MVCGQQRLTYAELEQRANRLARYLRLSGVQRGDCVGLVLPRSCEICVTVLGILKTGAAYVPIDADFPAERVAFILADCGARALVTTSDLSSKSADFKGKVISLDQQREAIDRMTSEKPDREEIGLAPNDLCYVIYTSGTTGKPKGVEIEHRSVCHLVQAEAEIFQIRADDRVFQGASIAFDASVEEIWLALHAGATLVIGTSEMIQAGPALPQMLTQAGISVLSCVPTLLLMMEEDVPTLRLLILGGESCPAGLVQRWWRPGRRVVNTYGPTEATVISTYAECHPDRPVTIGMPVPNYSILILDAQMQPVAQGVAGELCIGGIGVARGYLGRPELTREKFVWLPKREPTQRAYRTGDLARWTPDGEIEFLGRIDTQVKIRGFRVELGEIEAALMECAEVKTAAVALREDVPGVQQLVAYVVPRGHNSIDDAGIRKRLAARLPGYMVPAIFEQLEELPKLASGKVDRNNLPLPTVGRATSRGEPISARTALEKEIGAVWGKLFAPVPISIRDDFFLDSGGHSLLAARLVSELRKQPVFAGISMLDVYNYPTIEGLAARFEITGLPMAAALSANFSGEGPVSRAIPIPFRRHLFCGAAQLVSLLIILGFFALQWLAPYLTYTILIEQEFDYVPAILGAFASLIAFYPVMLAVPILVKWLVIGRYRPGAYPLWGTYFFRWWFATTIEAAVPVGYLTGTPLLNIYCRLMGAKIGRDVHLASDNFAIYDLLSLGDDTSINADANLLGYTIEDGWLKIGQITIGKGCFVGARAAIGENTVMENDSVLEDLSLLTAGGSIPRGETWSGSPAAAIKGSRATEGIAVTPASAPETNRASLARRFGFGVLHGILLLIFPVLVVAALFPGIVVMNELNYIDPYYWYLLLAPLVAASFIVLLALEIAAVKWLLLGKIKSGRYPLYSFYYLRKWFVDQTMDLSLDVLGPLYASVYLTPWYKLLGAKLGTGAEISTASFISPDLLAIGEESFIADSVSLGAPRVRDGFMKIGRNQIGKRSFIGNSAMLPPDTIIGDKVLIGCLSSPPPDPLDALREGSTWLGSPPIFLPQRQVSATFPEEATFHPTSKLRIQRAIIEFIRVIAPSACFIVLLSLLFSALLLLADHYTLAQTLLFFPFLYAGCGVAAAVFTIGVKWLLVGRYQPGEKPLWSTFVWRNELVNALHEHLAEPFLVGAFTGTPFVCWYFRFLGARIGKRVYVETTDFSEFDLVTIGDEAALNADCTIQTHLFEDRVMKMSTIKLGSRCKVGAGSLVLYDTRMEDAAALGDLSLLMKGEALPASTRWEGIPARPEKQ